MSFLEAFLNVLAILGLIVAGGFLVFLLGNLLLSILEPRRAKLQEKEEVKQKEEVCEFNQVQEFQQEPNNEVVNEFANNTITKDKFVLEEEEPATVDFDVAEQEKKSLGIVPQPQPKVEEKSDDINSIFNDNEDFNFADEDFDFDKLFAEDKVNGTEQAVKTEHQETANLLTDIVENNAPVTTSVSAKPEVKEVIKEVYVENHEVENQLRSELELLKQELASQKLLYEELREQAKNNEQKWEQEKSELEKLYTQAEVQEEEKTVPLLTLEEYEARLEVLKERLKVNEKELKLNKKEFIPLRRVRKNLDKDKDKLRRREALVAKQKVMLYGVNNISEIDQDKAKKLAEDLDLLDGLKVSVRHCEEVMEANKDRYPILETANRILTTTHQELKDDIAECEKAIYEIKKANGDVSDEGAVLTLNAENISDETPAKRKRGRPKKVQLEEIEETEEVRNENKETIVSLNNLIERQDELFENTNKAVVPDVVPTYDLSAEHEKLFEDLNEELKPKTEPHKYNFDDEEPSFEDLFAIENEENNNSNK